MWEEASYMEVSGKLCKRKRARVKNRKKRTRNF